ncbi:MAG: flagellin [Paracoccaceae bacterium]|nr:flagellin [Paracoccaceae bacterium]
MTPDFMTVGDYARQLVQRRQNAEVRAQMDRLLAETGSGKTADLPGALRGDFTRLAAFERDIADLAAFETAGAELRMRIEAAQRALGSVQDDTKGFAGDLMNAPIGQGLGLDVLADDARGRFEATVSRLNTTVAGRTVFAGIATDGPALAPAEDMLMTLEALVSSAPDAASAEAAVRDWFAPGGGFDTAGYLGDTTPVPDQPIGPGVRLGLSVTAEDAAIRNTLAALAVAAFSGTGPMAGSPSAQQARLVNAGLALHDAQTGLSDLRGRIGAGEARLDEVATRNAAETSALEIARSALTDVDIYDKATELEAVQGQLELLYAITARSARLSLVSAL